MKTSFFTKTDIFSKSAFMVLFLVMMAIHLEAQPPQYYNYNISGGGNSFPFNISGGKKVQLLYLPGDFNRPFAPNAGMISSISFMIRDALGPWMYKQFTIKLGQSNINAFTPGSFYSGTLKTVYYRDSVLLSGTSGSWMTITLDSLFAYDPAKSLIVDIGQCSAAGATGFSMYYTNLSGNRRNYSVGGCPFTLGGQNDMVYHMGFNLLPDYYNYNITGSANSFPFNISAGKDVQLLYLPGDFNQPSSAPAGKIKSLFFRINDNYPLGPWKYSNFTIKMGQSGITDFTSGNFYSGSMDTVFYRDTVTLAGIPGSWLAITLDQPFTYDPTQSLIVDVGQCGITGGSGFSASFTNLTGNRRIWSVGGCPFTYSSYNNSVYHIGMSICSAPPAPVNNTPSANLSVCFGNSTRLSATGTGTLGWYNAPAGGTYLGSGPNYITPVLNSTTTYYVQDSTCDVSQTRTAITVTVNPVYSFIQNDTICNGETFHWQGSDYTTANTYKKAYTTIHGCDSTYTLNLTVNPSYLFSENHSICAGQTYYWRGNDYTVTDTYNIKYTTALGCDSIYQLVLNVNPSYSFIENKTICDSQIFNWRGKDYSVAGTYSDSFITINGCDSIYSLVLIVNPVYLFTEFNRICNGEIYNWQGANYSANGTYTAKYSTINGCDSNYTLYLTVKTVDVSVTVNDPKITANETGATYQWVDCDNAYAVIGGETLQSYTAHVNGNYAVIVTKDTCSDTSVCTSITHAGLARIPVKGILVYPNPVSDELIIENRRNEEKTDFEIYNSMGQVVFKGILLQKATISTIKYTPGVYLLKIRNGKTFEFLQIIKD